MNVQAINDYCESIPLLENIAIQSCFCEVLANIRSQILGNELPIACQSLVKYNQLSSNGKQIVQYFVDCPVAEKLAINANQNKILLTAREKIPNCSEVNYRKRFADRARDSAPSKRQRRDNQEKVNPPCVHIDRQSHHSPCEPDNKATPPQSLPAVNSQNTSSDNKRTTSIVPVKMHSKSSHSSISSFSVPSSQSSGPLNAAGCRPVRRTCTQQTVTYRNPDDRTESSGSGDDQSSGSNWSAESSSGDSTSSETTDAEATTAKSNATALNAPEEAALAGGTTALHLHAVTQSPKIRAGEDCRAGPVVTSETGGVSARPEHTSSWDDDKDKLLWQAVTQHGTRDWGSVAVSVGGDKSTMQCHLRWLHLLHQGLGRTRPHPGTLRGSVVGTHVVAAPIAPTAAPITLSPAESASAVRATGTVFSSAGTTARVTPGTDGQALALEHPNIVLPKLQGSGPPTSRTLTEAQLLLRALTQRSAVVSPSPPPPHRSAAHTPIIHVGASVRVARGSHAGLAAQVERLCAGGRTCVVSLQRNCRVKIEVLLAHLEVR